LTIGYLIVTTLVLLLEGVCKLFDKKSLAPLKKGPICGNTKKIKRTINTNPNNTYKNIAP
jgi:hypothetical protein